MAAAARPGWASVQGFGCASGRTAEPPSDGASAARRTTPPCRASKPSAATDEARKDQRVAERAPSNPTRLGEHPRLQACLGRDHKDLRAGRCSSDAAPADGRREWRGGARPHRDPRISASSARAHCRDPARENVEKHKEVRRTPGCSVGGGARRTHTRAANAPSSGEQARSRRTPSIPPHEVSAEPHVRASRRRRGALPSGAEPKGRHKRRVQTPAGSALGRSPRRSAISSLQARRLHSRRSAPSRDPSPLVESAGGVRMRGSPRHATFSSSPPRRPAGAVGPISSPGEKALVVSHGATRPRRGRSWVLPYGPRRATDLRAAGRRRLRLRR